MPDPPPDAPLALALVVALPDSAVAPAALDLDALDLLDFPQPAIRSVASAASASVAVDDAFT
jgi:hypothetical protein